jgi:hypothetical protein
LPVYAGGEFATNVQVNDGLSRLRCKAGKHKRCKSRCFNDFHNVPSGGWEFQQRSRCVVDDITIPAMIFYRSFKYFTKMFVTLFERGWIVNADSPNVMFHSGIFPMTKAIS